jgi:AraC-like DNA-binding protein
VLGEQELQDRARTAEPSWLARVVSLYVDRVVGWGVSRAALLHDARVREEQLSDPEARVPVSGVIRLWRAIASHVADPTVGLRLGSDTRAKEFGLVGYTMVCSPTLHAALKRLDRYERVVSQTLNVELTTSGEATWVRLEAQSALAAFRPAADARLSSLLAVIREITDGPIDPIAVQLPYRKPEDVQPYEQFYRGPLEFGTLGTAILLNNSDLERRIVACDETLLHYLDVLGEQMAAALSTDPTVSERVRSALWPVLQDGAPTAGRVARTLGMSTRTLQRRLRAEGETFAGVLARLRGDMAPALLRDGRLAVSEVAFLLGYEDPSSFRRAFRRAFGVAPRAFRSTNH